MERPLEKRFNFSRNSSFWQHVYACDVKFVGINVRGTCLISKNHEHLSLEIIIPAIQYVITTPYRDVPTLVGGGGWYYLIVTIVNGY